MCRPERHPGRVNEKTDICTERFDQSTFRYLAEECIESEPAEPRVCMPAGNGIPTI